jgi:hypothetical protein
MNKTLAALWHRSLRRFGLPGVAATVLLIGAAALAGWSVQLDQDAEALRQRLEAVTRAAAAAAPLVAAAPLPVDQQVSQFVATFPPVSQTAADLNAVFQSAKRRHIPLNRASYQLNDERNATLLTLTATFPVTASYRQVKEFAADVLRTLPHASLDELTMSRSTAGDAVLDTSVRFSFSYRRT